MERVTIVGVGGIGSHLAEDVARLLAYCGKPATLTLVDGDHFEDRNGERQAFTGLGNKATAKQRELAAKFPTIRVDAMAEDLTPENAPFILLPGEMVLVCVDNHPTRKLVAEVAATVEDITVISGGNDDTYGTVLLYLRHGGQELNPPITVDHPEIANPADRAPWELSCEERAAAGAPQVFAANVAVASAMLNVCWDFLTDPAAFRARACAFDPTEAVDPWFDEIHLDVRANRVRPRRRGDAGISRAA